MATLRQTSSYAGMPEERPLIENWGYQSPLAEPTGGSRTSPFPWTTPEGEAAVVGPQAPAQPTGGGGYNPGTYTAPTTRATTASARTGLRTVSRTPRRPTGGTSVTQWTPAGPAPTLAPYPEFTAPEWDEAAIKSLAQQRAAPGVRRLREATRRATQRASYAENPAVTAMSLREALAGYGTGLESVLGGAARTARGEYGEEYGREFQTAQIQHQARQRELDLAFQAAMQAWSREGTQTTTRRETYEEPGGGGTTRTAITGTTPGTRPGPSGLRARSVYST